MHRRQASTNSSGPSLASPTSAKVPIQPASTSSSLAAAFSFAGLSFKTHSIKAAHLTLTPHHLFYLLSRVEELGINIGPMTVRLENLTTEASPSNYVSFLQAYKGPGQGRSDRDSLHSVSSMRSVMSGMTSFWSSIGLGSGTSRSERAKAATEADLKYLYSAFTKLPSLRLTSDPRARLIKGYEEFPFDTAVPLFAFKNIQQLDIIDLDFRQIFGWDRLAEQLTLMTVKRSNLDDPAELLTDIVLDDAEKRRRRSTKGSRGSPTLTASWTMPSTPQPEYAQSNSDPASPAEDISLKEEDTTFVKDRGIRLGPASPKRPSSGRPTSSYRHVRSYSTQGKRTGSGGSTSTEYSVPHRSDSSSNLLAINVLASTKWHRLKYLSLADNSLTSLPTDSLTPLATSLRSFNLSSNLFTEIPESLASLTRLTSLDLSNCMIGSLQSLLRSPLPAITTLKLKTNRLQTLAGVERLLSLENLNVQDNKLSDPMEAARLTALPNLRWTWVKHNPFTKVHSNYRVTIFNLFRSTPGYVEDVIIDDSGPSFTERKHLLDRAPEVERRVVRIVHAPTILEEPRKPERLAETEAFDSYRSSSRRKKGSRRIVDLAQDNSPRRGPSETIVIARTSLEERPLERAGVHPPESPHEAESNIVTCYRDAA